MMSEPIPERFTQLVAAITGCIAEEELHPALADELMRQFPPSGATFQELADLCRLGVDDGWLCTREAGGIKFGRAVKPSDLTHGYSVDVVDMDSVVGPHHLHPHGEVDMVMPLDADACFDGVGSGWKVYEPGSAHHPTVTDGRALVLYLLPGGAIQFTDSN